MTSSFYKYLSSLLLCVLCGFGLHGQTLKVVQSSSDRIYREMSDGHALVLFESDLENLTVESAIKDKVWRDTRNNRELIFIEARVADDSIFCVPNERKYCLKADNTDEYYLTVENMQPKNVYYYVVTLQKRVPLVLAAEYHFTPGRQQGVRASLGKRFGGYASYQWGPYLPSGNDISTIISDADVSSAELKGYIKALAVAGLRTCVNTKYVPVYLFVGAGYGHYGRQWENPKKIENSRYFYSDYIKGAAVEAGVTIMVPYVFPDYFKPTFTVAMDAVMNKSRLSMDYQIGFGLSFNLDNIIRLKK